MGKGLNQYICIPNMSIVTVQHTFIVIGVIYEI